MDNVISMSGATNHHDIPRNEIWGLVSASTHIEICQGQQLDFLLPQTSETRDTGE